MATVRTVFLTLGLLALFAPEAFASEVEVLLGISTNFDKQELTLQVASSGCTAKADFTFELKDEVLTVSRTKKDECKAIEQAIFLTYSLKEAGIDVNKPFKLGNKLAVDPMLPGILKK